jgi:hypothetical protein
MGKVTFNMTMSLDGFVAGPNDGPENSLGDGGARLFDHLADSRPRPPRYFWVKMISPK